MEEALLVGRQILLILIYVSLGIVVVKTGLVDQKAGKSLSNLALYVVTPCVVVNSYLRDFEPRLLRGLLVTFVLAVIAHVIAIVLSNLLIRKRGDERYRVERLAAVYSNCAYMGIPLITAAVGEVGVFYAVAFISVFNIFVWSHGVVTLAGRKEIKLSKVLLNPGTIAFYIGILLYFTQLPLPGVVTQVIGGISVMNTPLPMLTAGIFLADIKLGKTLRQGRLYYVSAIRLVLVPLVMLGLIRLLQVQLWLGDGKTIVMASMMAIASPTAATAVLLPAKYEMDSRHGAKIMGFTTLFSIVTIPLFSFLVNWMF